MACDISFERVKSIEVRLGVNNRSDLTGVQIIKAASWRWHERFTKFENETKYIYDHDVGLIKLEKPAQLNQNVGLMRLSPHLVKEGMDAGISGWGLTMFFGESSDVLLQATVKVISNEECQKTFDFLKSYMVCTLGKNGAGFCSGDEGAPLIINGSQVAIASYGDYECNYYKPIVPTYHSRLQAFLTWIETHSDYRP